MSFFVYSEIENRLKQLEVEYQEHQELAKNLENKRRTAEEEKFDADSELEKQRSLNMQKEREYNMLLKESEYAKDRQAVLMADR